METVLIVNTAATCVMTGVIWFVQRVHYPLLAIVGTERAIIVAQQHQRRTGQVVALPMAAEGVTTLVLLLNQPNGVSMILPWIGAVLLAIALGCTVTLSVPLHSRMATTPSIDTGARLVRTNWPRTVAWTLRAGVCVAMLLQMSDSF